MHNIFSLGQNRLNCFFQTFLPQVFLQPIQEFQFLQDMPVYETLRLMYSCKHFIISNSTFSWWGQYLSQNDNKVVVSPRVWNSAYKSMLVDEKWILIDS